MNIKNHKNLTINCKFEELPEWFQNAYTYNANIVFNNNYITWVDGTWESGIWETGIWETGIWESGIWESGLWQTGIWEYGTWEKGTWEDGTWEDGTWQDGTWEDGYRQIGKCKWGVYYNITKSIIKIGCYEKSVTEWDEWFNSTEEFETNRNSEQFNLIEQAYKLAKLAIENKL